VYTQSRLKAFASFHSLCNSEGGYHLVPGNEPMIKRPGWGLGDHFIRPSSELSSLVAFRRGGDGNSSHGRFRSGIRWPGPGDQRCHVILSRRRRLYFWQHWGAQVCARLGTPVHAILPSYSYPSPLRFHCFFSAPTAAAVSRTREPAAAAERGGHATATRPLAA